MLHCFWQFWTNTKCTIISMLLSLSEPLSLVLIVPEHIYRASQLHDPLWWNCAFKTNDATQLVGGSYRGCDSADSVLRQQFTILTSFIAIIVDSHVTAQRCPKIHTLTRMVSLSSAMHVTSSCVTRSLLVTVSASRLFKRRVTLFFVANIFSCRMYATKY